MPKVLVVENDAAYLAELVRTLQEEFGEKAEVVPFALVPEAIAYIRESSAREKVDFALVDLELGPGDGDPASPHDLDGRDLILHHLRAEAPWVPVILMSRYLSGNPLVLAEVTSYGFDLVIPKKFFSQGSVYRREWTRARHLICVARIATLTGRSVSNVSELLEQRTVIECGAGVESELEKYDRGDFERVIRALDLHSSQIVLDEVVQGFSGLSVARAIADRGGARRSWLLKFGDAIGKLNREVAAHRKMFVDGLLRGFSVSLLWWNVVAWRSIGAIAYEFEEGARTLLEFARENGTKAALLKSQPALQALYEGSERRTVIPRFYLKDILSGAPKMEEEHFGELLRDVATARNNRALDGAIELLIGPQHGDLHLRNVLLVNNWPLLIDFAHYRSVTDKGCPLVDLAKILVDSWAFNDDVELGDLLDLGLLDQPDLRPLAKLFLIGSVPTESERRFFQGAVLCYLARYSTYSDVSADKRMKAADTVKAY